MPFKLRFPLGIFLLSFFSIVSAQSFDITAPLVKQLKQKDEIIKNKFPVYTGNGVWTFNNKPNWLSGFGAGELWNLYDITKDEDLKVRALRIVDNLIQYSTLDNTHDLGFMFIPSLVKAYKVTGNKKYRDAAIQAAYMLAKRFNANGNFIRAWGALNSNDREGLMIIDTMLNLELLFWAARETGDWNLYDIAYKHAITCMRNNVRDDFSSFHVVEFNPKTGDVIAKRTHQGVSDSSTWARGQAWGIYGFALAYQYTRDERFLSTSKKMADYFLSHLPQDKIPYWDLTLSGDTVARDASAGAIAASGMALLANLAASANESDKYHQSFMEISESLITNYTFLSSRRKTEQGLLMHTVYNYAKNWGIDESFPCGDYYFTEVYCKYWNNKRELSFIQNVTERREYNINRGWKYLEDDIKNFQDVGTSAKEWRSINLPHTWNTEDIYDLIPGYRRAVSWYRKEIYFPAMTMQSRFILSFEAVNIQSEIYINGQRAGGHIGGYIGFEVDITPFVRPGKMNTILVKADNSVDINVIPSQKSDFNIMGGIPRNVWLKVVPAVHLDDFHIIIPQVTNDIAKTNISAIVTNSSNVTEKFALAVKITAPNGAIVAEGNQQKEIVIGENTIAVNLPDIKKPLLWSPDHPNLYTVEVQLKKGKDIIDKLTGRCGYRWYEFKEKGAFYLNGERLLLRGTHRHEERSGYANAIPDSLHRKDIELIKELGANFVRLAHYPQAPEVYRACDELGLLVWDEVPWCRGGMGTAQWQANVKRLFTEQINQHFNHPSIILWSIGNESDWLPDFPDGDNVDSLKAFTKQMHDLAKSLDPYRLTSTRKFEEAAGNVDVFSPSMWPGWYSTVYKEYDKVLATNREKYKRMIHIEYGGDSHVGRHTENPITGEGVIPKDDGQEKSNQVKVKNIANEGDWSESYIVNLFDWYLKSSETSDWLSGSAQWVFRDFGTPLRPENPIPYVNQKGLLDLNDHPKDAYYVYKSYWLKDPKFCYIESHTWKFRAGKASSKMPVKVFSNCDSVEVFLNGASQGMKVKDIKQFPASGLLWNVSFAEGANTIIANGFSAGKFITSDTVEIQFTSKKIDKADAVVFAQERLPNGNFLITATVVDVNKLPCIDFSRRIYFSSISGGRLVMNGGSPTRSAVIEAANGVAQIEVKALPFEENVIEVRTQDLKGFYYTINY